MQSDTVEMADRPLEAEETDRLISSEKVDGTAVYDFQGQRLGTIHHLMIDKFSGRVEYAVMSFGGFLGVGEIYHPLPWRTLTYNTDLGGYRVDLDRVRLEQSPRYTMSNPPDWSDRDYREKIDEYWISPV
jgi:sporulation protein YlmC with PRC-barrel domain